MAFDQSTRNRLQRLVNEARNLLTEEFTRQLQRDYGIDPKTGEVADIAKLSDLDDSRLETARVLRQVFAHYLATESGGGRSAEAQVLDRIVREQAFTVLNRLAALRMAEARGSVTATRPRASNSIPAWPARAWVKLAMPTASICSASSTSWPRTCPACSTATHPRGAYSRVRRHSCRCWR